MKIFSTLAENGTPCTVAELAKPTGADVVFTGTHSEIQQYCFQDL